MQSCCTFTPTVNRDKEKLTIMYRKQIISVTSVLFFAAVGASGATRVFAQERELPPSQNSESADDKVTRQLAEARTKGSGIVVIDSTIPGQGCAPVEIVIGRKVNGELVHTRVRGSWRTIYRKPRFGGVKMLQEGEYYVLALICSYNKTIQTFNGPHAKFQVRTGELVNVGLLKFDYKRDEGFFSTTGTARKAVEELKPETMDALRETWPKAITKMVNRPMQIVGGVETRTDRKLGPFEKLFLGK